MESRQKHYRNSEKDGKTEYEKQIGIQIKTETETVREKK